MYPFKTDTFLEVDEEKKKTNNENENDDINTKKIMYDIQRMMKVKFSVYSTINHSNK